MQNNSQSIFSQVSQRERHFNHHGGNFFTDSKSQLPVKSILLCSPFFSGLNKHFFSAFKQGPFGKHDQDDSVWSIYWSLEPHLAVRNDLFYCVFVNLFSPIHSFILFLLLPFPFLPPKKECWQRTTSVTER